MTKSIVTRGRKHHLHLVVVGLPVLPAETERWERQLIEAALAKLLDQPAATTEVCDATDH